MTASPPPTRAGRHIESPDVGNLRDLGGIPLGADHRVRPGRLFRSDLPESLTDAGRAVFASLELRTVVDLRSTHEVEERPSALAELLPVTSVPIPESSAPDEEPAMAAILGGRRDSFTVEDLTDLYQVMVRDRAADFGRAVIALGAPGALPALIHCRAGKDRTGLVVAFVLDSIGVDREEIVADFELTTGRRAHRREPFVALSGRELDPSRLDGLFVAPRVALLRVFAGIEERFGSVSSFLTQACAVPPEALERLAAELREPVR